MTALLLSVLSSTLIVLIFKYFDNYKVHTFNAIVVNYLVCVFCGILLNEGLAIAEIVNKSWINIALILGFLFITSFFAMGSTVKYYGVTVGTVVSKMSIAISVSAAFIIFNENVNAFKIFGIITALLAVILVSKKNDEIKLTKKYLLFPLFIFLGSAIIEILLTLADKNYLKVNELNEFNIALFFIAFFLGFLVLLFLLITKRTKFTLRDFIAGIILGVPNYFSIYFLMKALAVKNWGASFVYPIVNVSVISLAAFLSFLLLKEKISKLNLLGILISIISIYFITLGS